MLSSNNATHSVTNPCPITERLQKSKQNKAITFSIGMSRIKRALCACVRVHTCLLISACLLGFANYTLYEHSDQCAPWLEWSLAMNINFAFIASCSPRCPTWHKRESAFCLCQRLAKSAAQLLHPASLPQGHQRTLRVVWDVERGTCAFV